MAGSGNLTARGLRGNWEAFILDELDEIAAEALESQWTRWVERNSENLRPLDDEKVFTRASLNIRKLVPRPIVRISEEENDQILIEPAEDIPQSRAVLVAELPRASNRWNQANFDLNSFRNFFDAEPGRTQRIVLQHVGTDGSLEELENRPSVSVRSRNFRFELEAASGLSYPSEGRPIAVFIKIALRTFRYRLLMPSDPQYRIVKNFLEANSTSSNTRMQRVITDTGTLKHEWPDSPLWVKPLDIEE
jgi:hypothetical protein